MKATKRVGICLDHTTARVIEFHTEEQIVKTIKADLKGLDNQDGLQHSESLLHHKENQHLKAYYKDLITVIKDYDEIVLFGPTNAKTELFNLIREEHKYDHLKIETKAADKMNYEDQHAFVVHYFKTLLNYEPPYIK